MRSGARANVLMNVTSARMDIKAAAARAERLARALRRAVLRAMVTGRWIPRPAWRRVIEELGARLDLRLLRGSGLGAGAVRFAEAEQIARISPTRRSCPVAEAAPHGSAVWRTRLRSRANLVELDLLVPEEVERRRARAPGRHARRDAGTRPETAGLHRVELLGREIPEFVHRRLHGAGALPPLALNGFTVDRGPRLVFDLDSEQDPPALDVVGLRAEIEAAAARTAGRQCGGRAAHAAAPAAPRAPGGIRSAGPGRGPVEEQYTKPQSHGGTRGSRTA